MIIFTVHALKRMRGRGVSRRQVAVTVEEPDLVETDANDVKLFGRKFSSHALEAVAEISKNKIIIITVYWL